ncbi:unnamed protein product [Victoria cruziana]
MRDIELFNDGFRWVRSQKNVVQAFLRRLREGVAALADRHGPIFCRWCSQLGKFLLFLLLQWRDCTLRGIGSLLGLRSAALFVIIWSCFLSLTSISCLLYVVVVLGAAGVTVRYLGYTPGLFIVGLFGILMLSIYGNLWITGMISIIGGYLFSLNHARLVVLMSTAYAIYCVKVRVGLLGVILSVNLAFLSNDLLDFVLQEYECVDEGSSPAHDAQANCSSEEFEYVSEHSSHSDDPIKFPSKASCQMPNVLQHVEVHKKASANKVVKEDTNSLDEIKRILGSKNHYEAMGLARNTSIDLALLRKEYRKKAMVVHPDKNMGIPLASESFKKLQCAYEVLSDEVGRKSYDEQLRKEASRESSSIRQGTRASPQPDGVDYRSEESRRIHCTKCGNFHIWVCTSRSKAKARWCQDCHQYHQARDGDGWVELGFTRSQRPQKVDIPRAYVCAESKIFDVSEWAICQGMACKPNTHRTTFHVNMVGLEKKVQRSKSDCRFASDLDAELASEKGDEEFDVWLQQALAAGLFSDLTETSSRRKKSWSSFLINQKKFRKQWRSVL